MYVVEYARGMVVATGKNGMTKAQLSRLGLGVADAYYGRVTSITDILPYLNKILSGSVPSSYDRLGVHVQAVRAVNILMRSLLDRGTTTHDNIHMLGVDCQKSVYNILLSSVTLLSSDEDGDKLMTSTTMEGGRRREREQNDMAELRDLCTESVRCLIDETNIWRRTQSNVDDSSGQLYELCFANVVPLLLKSGMVEEVSQMGEEYVHYDTLYEVCSYVHESDHTEGRRLMQKWMEDPSVCTSDEYNKEHPTTFPHYVYNRL